MNAVKDAYMEEGVNAQRNEKLAFLEDLEKVYIASEEKFAGSERFAILRTRSSPATRRLSRPNRKWRWKNTRPCGAS